MPERKYLNLAAAHLAAFILLWSAYVNLSIGTSGDSRWTLPAAMSLLREGNLDLDEYAHQFQPQDLPALEQVGGHHYSIFPIGTTIMAAPFAWTGEAALQTVLWAAPGLEERLQARLDSQEPVTILSMYWRVEQAIAACFAAAAVLLMFHIARRRLPFPQAILVALIFGFCTSLWSIGATALWQHSASTLLLTAVLFLLLTDAQQGRHLAGAGVLLAFAYVVRPTNLLPLVLLSLYVLLARRRCVLAYGAGAIAVLTVFALYNLFIYGTPLPPYYQAGRLEAHPYFVEALVGNLTSPARGLFVYSPILLFSLLGAGIRLRAGITPFEIALGATIVLHWCAISAFPHWWGGVSYGPRFFTDLLPFFMYFLIAALEAFPSRKLLERRLLQGLFAGFSILSLLLQWKGAASMEAWRWNLDPGHIDHDAQRLWDWRDPPFLR